ncbi:MAG: efflux RND transporter permease subunit [Candidatus Buchananbacteria bacterium]
MPEEIKLIAEPANLSGEEKSSDYKYLENLTFDKSLKKGFLYFFVKNIKVVFLLLLLISAWGIYSFVNLPRESNPEVKIPIAIVTDVYPGVSPADMEELVTKKIETGISGVKGIKKITSNSANSLSAITVEFDANENVDDAIRRLKDQVNSIQNNLPQDANDAVVTEISLDDSPIWTFTITGPYDGFTLRGIGDDIKDELEKIPGVREVQVSGGDEKEFQIAYDPDKLVQFSLSTDSANQLVRATNLAVPAGTFEGSEFNYSIRTDSRFFDAEALGNIPILHTDNGGIVYLKDIARVQEKAIKKTVFSRLSANGQAPEQAVTLSIIKKVGQSIPQTVESGKKTLEEQLKQYPDIKTTTIVDASKDINDNFEQLTHDFILTIILVFGVLLLIVGLKEAFVAGLAVPLVFFITFGTMLASGISLNFLSIFSLLLALGLLVDDAIVVVTATKQYMKTGKFTPEEAVLLVLRDYKGVLLTTTLATVWAFLPLLLSTGIIGEFIKSIPITVSVTLITSLIVALVINPPLAATLERSRITKKSYFVAIGVLIAIAIFALSTKNPIGIIAGIVLVGLVIFMVFFYKKKNLKSKFEENKKLIELESENDDLIKEKLNTKSHTEHKTIWGRVMNGFISMELILPWYERTLRKLLSTKKIRFTVIGIAFALFIAGSALLATGIVATEFFPVSDQTTLSLGIEAPIGTNVNVTNSIVIKVEEKLLKYPEIVSFDTVVGSGGGSSFLSGGSSQSSHVASITINLKDKKDRKLKSFELANAIRDDIKDIKGATITLANPSSGPPAGAAFEARVYGKDLQTIDKIANDLKPYLDSIPGVVDSEVSLKEAPAEYTFFLDPIKMEFYNLNSASVGGVMRMAIAGTKITTVIRDGKEIDVNATFDENKIPNLEAIENLQIINNRKQPVFLKDVATIKLTPSVNSLTRIDQKSAVLLSAGVEGKTRPNDVVKKFQDLVAKNYKLPSGYSIVYGGENEQNTESVTSILYAMIIAFVLIISTLVIQFNSFKKSFIVLMTIPLALIGVFFGLAISRITLSFPGLIGVLALFGIVVKNAIILIDKINLNLKHDIEFTESIVDAGKSRLEAIFITSICTILGLIPITLSNDVWKSLGSAVIFGLTISSFLTLFIVPIIFATVINPKEKL